MRVQVTQQHINNGVRGSCSSDPISLAMKDAGFDRPWVSPDKITATRFGIGGSVKHFSSATPDSVLLFMKAFDNGVFVYPFSFELEGV